MNIIMPIHPHEKTVKTIINNCFCVLNSYHEEIGSYKDIPFLEDYQYIEKIPINFRNNVLESYIITNARRYKIEMANIHLIQFLIM